MKMKRFAKLMSFILVLLVAGGLCLSLNVHAANAPVLTVSASSVQAGKSVTATVGYTFDAGSLGAIVEVEYDADFFWFGGNIDKGAYTDSTEINGSKITIVFLADNPMTSLTQTLNFAVLNGSAVGSNGTIKVTVTEITDGDFNQPDPGDVLTSVTATKTVTVAAVPTPTPTPTRTPTSVTPTPSAVPTAAPTDEGTEGPTDEATATGTDETETPTETAPGDETTTPGMIPSAKPTDSKPGVSNQEFINAGAFGFTVLIALVVGIWIGIGIGFLIWGRKGGRKIRPTRVIGNDDY